MKNIFLRISLYGIFLCGVLFAIFYCKTSHAETLSRSDIKETIRAASRKYGVDYELALAIAQNESGLNPNARGSHGEVGVFQLHPKFHPIRGERSNIYTAIRYIAKLKDVCAGYGDAYFVCYNYGTTRKLKYPKRFAYYRRVKHLMFVREQKIAECDPW